MDNQAPNISPPPIPQEPAPVPVVSQNLPPEGAVAQSQVVPAPTVQNISSVVPASPTPKKSSKIPLIIAVILILLAGAGSAYYFLVYKNSSTLSKDQSEIMSVSENFDEIVEDQQETLPTLTSSDSVADIEKDIDGTEVSADGADFKDVDNDLDSL